MKLNDCINNDFVSYYTVIFMCFLIIMLLYGHLVYNCINIVDK